MILGVHHILWTRQHATPYTDNIMGRLKTKLGMVNWRKLMNIFEHVPTPYVLVRNLKVTFTVHSSHVEFYYLQSYILPCPIGFNVVIRTIELI